MLKRMTAPCCPRCGACGCRAAFDACLVLDYSDSRYGTVHHLTVATYMLQHGIYADGVTADAARFIIRHIDRPPDPYTMKELRRHTDGATKVVSPDSATSQRLQREWPYTIRDVDTSNEHTYRRTVRRWAKSVADHILELLDPLPGS